MTLQSTIPFQPMEPVLVENPFDSPDYVYQVKWDGVRQIASKSGDDVQLWTRRGTRRTIQYPEIVEVVQSLPVHDCILDGEVISFGDDGRPNFRRVLRRDLARQAKLYIPVCYVVFDCLRVNDTWLFEESLERRQARIQTLIEGRTLLQPCTNFQDGTALYERMQALGMEGIVAKRRGSLYHPGKKSDVWQKIKCWQTIQVRATGVNWKEGRPASIVVADTDDLKVELAAVSSGLSSADWRQVLEHTERSVQIQKQKTPIEEPFLMDVRFIEWTDDGHLRSPVVERVYFPGESP